MDEKYEFEEINEEELQAVSGGCGTNASGVVCPDCQTSANVSFSREDMSSGKKYFYCSACKKEFSK